MTSAPDPLVSVVLTCFDSDPVQLAEAIDSALAQTYPAVEIILVDDGSTRDETCLYLQGVDATRVTVLRQENRGVSAARNAGMTAARGEFLLPLDGDDLLEPSYLAVTVPVLRDEPRLAIVSTRAEYFGDRTGPMILPDVSLPWMVAENSIHNSSLFRRADFLRLGGYDEELRRGFEDHEWWARVLLHCGEARLLDDVLFRYRIRATSRNAAASSTDEALEDLRDAMLRNNPDRVEQIAAMALSSLDSALARMHSAEARVAHLEHHLGPVVRVMDRHPRIKDSLQALRRLRHRF